MLRDFVGNILPAAGNCYLRLDERAIVDRLPTGRISVLTVIDSTNQYLLDQIAVAAKLQLGDACVAEYQTQGRGRRGSKWISPYGQNLSLSLYWCFHGGQAAAIGLSIMVSIVIAEVLQLLGVDLVMVKLPNDIYLYERKLAGILVESYGYGNQKKAAAHVVIGAGINLTRSRYQPADAWIYLQDAGIILDRNALVAELTEALRQALPQFEQDGLAPFISRWHNFYNPSSAAAARERIFRTIASSPWERDGVRY